MICLSDVSGDGVPSSFQIRYFWTAKEVISCFQKLGVSFDLDEVSLRISTAIVCVALINSL